MPVTVSAAFVPLTALKAVILRLYFFADAAVRQLIAVCVHKARHLRSAVGAVDNARQQRWILTGMGDFSFLLRFGFSAVYYVICLIECFPVDDLQFFNILRASIFRNYVACIPLVADNSDYVARLELCSGTGTQSSVI